MEVDIALTSQDTEIRTPSLSLNLSGAETETKDN